MHHLCRHTYDIRICVLIHTPPAIHVSSYTSPPTMHVEHPHTPPECGRMLSMRTYAEYADLHVEHPHTPPESACSAYVSIRQHTSAYVSPNPQTSAYSSRIRWIYIYIYIYIRKLQGRPKSFVKQLYTQTCPHTHLLLLRLHI
jgi:hypothetical protein